MKVGVLTPSISRKAGGFFSSVRLLSAGTSREGCDVSVFSVEDDFSSKDAAHWSNVALNIHARGGPASFGYAPGLSASVDTADLDILHGHGLWMYPSVVARKWASRSGKPHIVSPHGMLDPWALANSRWKKRVAWALFERGNLDRAACLHALTEAEASAIRRMGLRNPIAVIPNGVDMPADKPEPRSPAWLHDQRALLLYLGRIHPKKGLAPLIEAWADLARRSKVTRNWVLAIAGWDDGGHRPALEAAIRAHALESDILLPGPLYGEAKETALRQARAFILPSLSEGLPIAVLEAWSYGLPVFMTKACGLPEGFRSGAAIEISVDPGALADRLASALDEDAALAAAGARGRELVRRQFSWNRVAGEMADVYRWLAGSAPRPATVL